MFLKLLDKLGRKKLVLDRGPSHPDYKNAILGTGFEVIKVVSVDKIISDASEARKLVD